MGGNLPTLGKEGMSKDLNKKLMEQFKQAGACKYAEIGKNGTGVAVFATKDEVEKAVTMLNGAVFEGQAVTVSAWAQGHGPKGMANKPCFDFQKGRCRREDAGSATRSRPDFDQA